MQHSLPAKVGTNFIFRGRRSVGMFCLLTNSQKVECYFFRLQQWFCCNQERRLYALNYNIGRTKIKSNYYLNGDVYGMKERRSCEEMISLLHFRFSQAATLMSSVFKDTMPWDSTSIQKNILPSFSGRITRKK
jgi:hypothetical protein